MCCEEDQYTESHTNLNSLKPIFLTVSIKHAEPIPSPPLLLASISSPWAPIQKSSPWHTRFSLHKIFSTSRLPCHLDVFQWTFEGLPPMGVVVVGLGFACRGRSGLGFNFVSSSSAVWVSVPVVVGVESRGGDGMGSACLIETLRKIGLSELKLCVIECIDLFIKSMTWQTLIGGGVKLAFYASSGQYVYVYSLVFGE